MHAPFRNRWFIHLLVFVIDVCGISYRKITFFEKRKKADKEKREEMLKQFMDREELLNKRIKELESNDPNFKVKKLKVEKEEDIVKLELLKKENELEETKKDSYK